MLNTRLFGEELKRYGFTFYAGVPCSFLKDLINYAINDLRYVAAANEGDAVAIAAGAYLGGVKSVVLMQNSGLTNATSPLTSLTYIFKIPVLGFVSLRGESGIADEPQHELMGEVTTQFLDLMRIKWEFLSEDFSLAKEQIKRANQYIENNQTFFFVVKKNTFEKESLKKQAIPTVKKLKKILSKDKSILSKRIEVLTALDAIKNNNTVLLATTGVTGRELYEINDVENNLYMVGSMGCISSLGLGLALIKPNKEIIVIDGDGSLLMRMGSLATNAAFGPKNLLHILLDNSAHDSTGGQDTASGNVSFVEVAASCGYQQSFFAHNLEELKQYVFSWQKEKALTFIHMKIEKGTKENLKRPHIKPFEVKERLMKFIEE